MTEHKHHGHKPHQDEECTSVEEDGDFSTLDSGPTSPPPPPPPTKTPRDPSEG